VPGSEKKTFFESFIYNKLNYLYIIKTIINSNSKHLNVTIVYIIKKMKISKPQTY